MKILLNKMLIRNNFNSFFSGLKEKMDMRSQNQSVLANLSDKAFFSFSSFSSLFESLSNCSSSKFFFMVRSFAGGLWTLELDALANMAEWVALLAAAKVCWPNGFIAGGCHRAPPLNIRKHCVCHLLVVSP